MKIEHIAMYVNDLEKVKEFFIKFFNAKSNNIYYNPKTGFRSYFLSFDGGARIEIMNKPQITSIDNFIETTGYIHIAFSVGSREKVDELTMKLKSEGYEIRSMPRITGDGYYESSIIAVEGNLIEITE